MIEYIIAYLIGSINFAYLIGKLFKIDISKFGDNNLGATNLYYALLEGGYKKDFALGMFLLSGGLDLLKTVIMTILYGPLVGAFTILGHCFSIFSIILTKRIPSGVGFASTLGWVIVADIRMFVFSFLFIPFYLLFGNIFKIERGHIFSVFMYPFIGWLYTLLFPKNLEVVYGFLIITISCCLARFLRIKIILEKCLK